MTMTITDEQRRKMQSKPRQFLRFVILNLKILTAIDRTKRR